MCRSFSICAHPGPIAPWADKLLTEFRDTYTEISVSGTGLHPILGGSFDVGIGKRTFPDGTGFEFYPDRQGRFFCVTGRPWKGAPSSIAAYDCQAIADRYKRGEIGPLRPQSQPKPQPQPQELKPHSYKTEGLAFNVAAFLKRHPIALGGPEPWNGGTRWLIECHGSHEGYPRNDGKAYIVQHPSGAIFAGCQHKNSCSWSSGNHWTELREHYEPKIHKLTDYGNGERLVDDHSHEMRWSKHFSDWLVWDDQHWTRDHKLQPERWAQHRARHINHEATSLTTKQSEIQTQLGQSESEEQDGDIRPN